MEAGAVHGGTSGPLLTDIRSGGGATLVWMGGGGGGAGAHRLFETRLDNQASSYNGF